MAATADPRAKQPPPASSRHLKPWAPPPRAHRVPSLPDVTGVGARDRGRRSSSSDPRGGGGGGGDSAEKEARDGKLEDLRAKLMGHLRDAADRLRLPPPQKPPPYPSEPEPAAAPPPLPTPPQQEAPAARPWNLRDRKRRPSARAAAAAAAAASFDDREPAAEKKAPSDDRAPFALALTAEEIEEDIYALTGARPRRRPRKRPRVVQRQLDTLFPGLWLTEITADAYKVQEE